MTHVVLLDRDGVLNVQREDYVKHAGELIVFPFVSTAIARLNQAGYAVIVVSNQQGIGKGVITLEILAEIEAEIARQLAVAGGQILSYYYCPHLVSEQCDCRKPKTGLLHRAAKAHRFALSEKVIFVGDSESDIEAGRTAGCTTVLVRTGLRTPDYYRRIAPLANHTADHLADAVEWILSER